MMKIDKNGNIEWQKKYGTLYVESQWFSFAQQTTDGGYIVAGSRDTHCWVLKLTNQGEISWQKDFGVYGYPYSIQQTTDGGYILGGLEKHAQNSYDLTVKFALLKLDRNGNVLWQKYYFEDEDTTAVFQPLSTLQTKDGGYIVAGWGDDVGRMFKFDINGNVVWHKIYSSNYAFINLQKTNDGGYAGFLGNFITKLDYNGNIVWQKSYHYIEIQSLQQTSDDGYIVGSKISDYPAFIKLNAQGDIDWQRIFKAHTNNYSTKTTTPMVIKQTTDGGYVAAYHYYDYSNKKLSISLTNLLKLDSYGNISLCDYFETVNEVKARYDSVGTVQNDTIYTEKSNIIAIDTNDVSQDVTSIHDVVCEGNINEGGSTTTTTIKNTPTTTTTIAATGARFKDNNNGTVTDTRTGLIWLKNVISGGVWAWAEAGTYCSTLKAEWQD